MSIPAFIEASKEVMPKISLVTDYGEESTYAIARLLMRFSRWILDILHMSHSTDAFVAVYSIVVFGVAFGLGWLIKALMVLALRHIRFKAPQSLYNLLLERHFFIKICRIIPPFVFLILIQFTLYEHVTIATWLTRLSWVYVVIIFTYSMCTLADCIWLHLDQRENTRRLPLKGIVQIIKIFLWIMATIIVTAVLINKSPATLLAGLGAFAAVLMLIFKDSILGVVAGVQLAQNDSLHVGDWIAVPNSNANGTVSEVSLTAVKIVNWDLTVTTVAPYNLITNGFTNYRNMQQSNTRRIQRSYMIDADSVVETTDQMLQEFRKIPLMADWIDAKIRQRDAGKTEDVKNSEGLADGTIDTNLGMFRAYMVMWLRKNPNISQTSDLFVTTLAQTAAGIPLQIYCFTSTSSWIPYEGIMASVFEHIAVMMYKFHLYIFENPSGRDTLIDGYLSPGKSPEYVQGIPYPFYQQSGTPMNPGIPPSWLYSKTPAQILQVGAVDPGHHHHHDVQPTPGENAGQSNPTGQPDSTDMSRQTGPTPSA